MSNDQYDRLLAEAREARTDVEAVKGLLDITLRRLGAIVDCIDQEESRIARKALIHMPVASRKLVVDE